ncbi:craniofacial development protein 1 [Diorhabda sublineata]|uniref:craniofacial development protein 1 n=1 Tax=Diorhabda sublineata TaxID=1163346 RepID=UPI0024E18474|nr:craniofacial development protein 1 [Diorhabda sublineata]
MNVNDSDLPEESDSSDEDYIPNEKTDDLPSEIDEDDPISEEDNTKCSGNSEKKEKKRKKKVRKKNEEEVKTIIETENEKKSNIDDLWADFVKDTGFKSKSSVKTNTPDSLKPRENISKEATTSKTSTSEIKHPNKVKVTQVFEFAGEEVKVEKEVSADSAEARLLGNSRDKQVHGTKRATGLSGISNVLNQLTKKQKISTLEKTKLDWDSYKKDNNIEEELQTFNKGKDGYLERQDFLQRTDVRRFEIERDIREIERNKRFKTAL